jgi:multiple sugar transport system permease protein
LAGLKNIPQELYEAAAIDGASVPQRFRHITLPLLRPTFLYVVVMGIIGAFQVFDMVYIVFSTTETIGGVLDSALTVVTYLYDQGFNLFELGYAASIAWVLFAVIFVMTMISLRVGRVNEQY